MNTILVWSIGALALAGLALRGLINGVVEHLESDDR
jgi:hypothetical protein